MLLSLWFVFPVCTPCLTYLSNSSIIWKSFLTFYGFLNLFINKTGIFLDFLGLLPISGTYFCWVFVLEILNSFYEYWRLLIFLLFYFSLYFNVIFEKIHCSDVWCHCSLYLAIFAWVMHLYVSANFQYWKNLSHFNFLSRILLETRFKSKAYGNNIIFLWKP